MTNQQKSIVDWARERGYIILDPDGFDRTNPNVMTDPITEEEFNKGFMLCTIQKI